MYLAVKAAICLMFGSLVLAGCGDGSPQAHSNEGSGSSTQKRANAVIDNEIRKGTGLRQIEEHWFLYRSDAQSDIWKERESGSIIKASFRDASGHLTSEDDYYYSGAQFTDSEGTAPELLTVRYNYETKRIGVFYRGTNTAIKGILAPVLMPRQAPSTNVTQVVSLVRQATKDWRDGIK